MFWYSDAKQAWPSAYLHPLLLQALLLHLMAGAFDCILAPIQAAPSQIDTAEIALPQQPELLELRPALQSHIMHFCYVSVI